LKNKGKKRHQSVKTRHASIYLGRVTCNNNSNNDDDDRCDDCDVDDDNNNDSDINNISYRIKLMDKILLLI